MNQPHTDPRRRGRAYGRLALALILALLVWLAWWPRAGRANPAPAAETDSALAAAASERALPNLAVPAQRPGGFPALTLTGHAGGPAQAVALSGTLLLAGLGPELAIIDAADPARPVRLSYIALSGLVHDLALSGTLAYVADHDLQVVELADPAAPQLVASASHASQSQAIAIAGRVAYLAGEQTITPLGNLLLYDLRNPMAPALRGQISFDVQARGVAVSGTRAYVANDSAGLAVLDVSDPANPVHLATRTASGLVYDVALTGRYALLAIRYCAIACAGALEIMDLADPVAPVPVHLTNLPDAPERLAVAGDVAVVASGQAGLAYFDISQPAQPVLIGLTAAGGAVRDVALSGSLVAAGLDAAGLALYSGQLPGPATGRLTSFGDALAVAGGAELAFVGTRLGLAVVDIEGATAGRTVGWLPLPAWVRGVAAVGSTAYLAAGDLGLLLVDATDPARPAVSGSVDTPGLAGDVLVDGAYAYVADGPAGLRVVNITDPANPVEVAALNTPGSAQALALVGQRLYLADGDQGLRLIDVSNPLAPIELSVLDTPGLARAVVADLDLAFVADGMTGLRVIDVADPANPIEVAGFSNLREMRDLILIGRYLYVANDSAGLLVVSVTDPVAPIAVIDQDTPGLAWGIASDAAGQVLLADLYGGLWHYYHGPFPLAGRVRQANGSAYDGVTVQTDQGLSTTTSAGYYLFAAASLGQHHVTPSLPGFVFDPAQQLVLLPPAATRVDFTILAPPVATDLAPGEMVHLVYTDTGGLTTTLHFPAQAVTAPTKIHLTPTVGAPVSGYAFAGHAFTLASPTNARTPDLTFARPVTISLRYGPADLAHIDDEASLVLFWWDGAAWVDAGTSCAPSVPAARDPAADLYTVAVCQTGRFALYGAPQGLFMPVIGRP